MSAGSGDPAYSGVRGQLAAFQKKLAGLTVLDPACGSGNFLYVSLQTLLDLEKEVVTYATQLGFKLTPQVSVQQLKAIEINPYAFELAQVSVQIGYLQWRRDNGFDNDRSPVLQDLDGFQTEDALLVPHFRSKAKTLKGAQAGEHAGNDALKFYTEREWPRCDVIVGNPPFLGTKKLRSELGDDYVEELFRVFGNRIPNFRLNPPEWTETRYLEFPGTVGGPWDRYLVGPLPSAGGPVAGAVPSLGVTPAAGSGDPAYKVGLVRYPRLVPKDAECAAQLKQRTLTNLYNERPAWLDLAHKKLDATVAVAYRWPADLTDEQILERLLALNLERAAEEAKAAKAKHPKTQRAKQTEELF